MAKRGLCILLAVLTLFALAVPAFAAGNEPKKTAASGNCGPLTSNGEPGGNAKWSLKNGVLTITGKGEVWGFGSLNKDDVNTVIIRSGVTSIGEKAFFFFWDITSLTLPDTLTTIGFDAFYSCARLDSVTIPDSVTTIEGGAFAYCHSLDSVTIPARVTSIGDGAFQYCESLTEINVAKGNKHYSSVDGVLFSADRKRLVQYPGGKSGAYTVPGGVTDIWDRAFSDCQQLTGVTIPDSVTSIGMLAFRNCSALTDVTIPKSVTSIGESAFAGCKGLKNVKIPESVISIGSRMFSECNGLTGVTIPKSVTSVGKGAFYQCGSLKSVTILNRQCEIAEPAYSGGVLDPYSLTFPTGTQIYGYKGSAAETYAKKYGYTFKALDKTPSTNIQLSAPAVKIAQTKSGISVTWNAVKDSPRYMVYYKENGGSWQKIGATAKTSYTRAAKYLKAGATYQFAVRCCASDKKTLLSSYKASNKVTYTVELAAPTVKIAQAKGGIDVTWNAVEGSSRYMVYYKENGGHWTKIGTTAKTSYTRAAKYLKAGATYQFAVRCCASDKKTLLSTYKASNKVTYVVELAAPTAKAAQVKGGIQVTWNAVKGSPRYMVYYKENEGSWQKIGDTAKTSYTRGPSKLKTDATYQFAVRCCAADDKTLLSGYQASNMVTYNS